MKKNKTHINLLKKEVRGEVKAQLVQGIMTAVIAVILLVAVAIPVTNNVINTTSVTGTTKTILDQVPVLLGAATLMAVIGTGLFFLGR